MTYAEENLKRVMKLPEDYPNRLDIIKHWMDEIRCEKIGQFNDRTKNFLSN